MKFQTIFWKEDDMYVIKKVTAGVTTQGRTIDEALANIKEAVHIYLEEMPDVKNTIQNMDMVGITSLKVP